MNRNELEAAAEERLFEAVLDEVVRDPAEPMRRVVASRSRWLAAAIVLLGLAVVVGVVMTSRPGPAIAVAPQDPAPLPPVVKVRGIEELQKVDRTIENLRCTVVWPSDLDALKGFSRLRAVRIDQDHDVPHNTRDLMRWSLAPLAECGLLESVSLGHVERFGAAELAPLAKLSKLRALELVGLDKTLDADFVALLHKLSLRSLVLHAVNFTPEGFRSLGELPLLERLELRDCTGLEKCDLKHLYRLRQLRRLTLRGVGGYLASRYALGRIGGPGAPPSRQADPPVGLPKTVPNPPLPPDEWPTQLVTAAWVRSLVLALPRLRELDLAESRLDDEVLAALPKSLSFLGLHAATGYGDAGIEAVVALPDLVGLGLGDPFGLLPGPPCPESARWLPMLRHQKLQRIEFTGVATPELVTALAAQSGLRELRLDLRVKWSWQIQGEGRVGGPETEGAFPSLAPLAELRDLQRIELVRSSEALEKAIRQAVGERVRIDVLER